MKNHLQIIKFLSDTLIIMNMYGNLSIEVMIYIMKKIHILLQISMNQLKHGIEKCLILLLII